MGKVLGSNPNLILIFQLIPMTSALPILYKGVGATAAGAAIMAIGPGHAPKNTAMWTRMCPAPFFYAIDNLKIVLLSLDGAFCAYLGPLPLLQSLSSRASHGSREGGGGNLPAHSLDCFYQHDHKPWPLHFKLPSNTLAITYVYGSGKAHGCTMYKRPYQYNTLDIHRIHVCSICSS